MTVKAFAVIAGVGSGTGTSLARQFAKEYPVALLARRPESYKSLVQEINDSSRQFSKSFALTDNSQILAKVLPQATT